HKMTIEDQKSPTMMVVSIIIRSIRHKPSCSTQRRCEHEHGRMVSANHRPLHRRLIGKYPMTQMFGNGCPLVESDPNKHNTSGATGKLMRDTASAHGLLITH